MNLDVARKRLARAEAKIAALEKLAEDKTRELYLAHQEVEITNEYLQNILRSMLTCLVVLDTNGHQDRNRATLEHGRFLSANPSLAQIHGYDSVAELISWALDIGVDVYVDPTNGGTHWRTLREDRSPGRNWHFRRGRPCRRYREVRIRIQEKRRRHGPHPLF